MADNAANTARLKAAVAKRANWNTPGDWTRCHVFLTSKGVADGQARRICSQWHHDATGKWPGDDRNK